MAQSQHLNVMQGQIDTLDQQAATLAANDEAAQAEEDAQSAQLADLTQQAATLAANDEVAQVEEMAQSQHLNVMQGQIDTLGQRVDALSQ